MLQETRFFINEPATAVFGRNHVLSDEDVPEGFHEITREDFEAFQAEVNKNGMAEIERIYKQSQVDKTQALIEAGIPEAAVKILLGLT